MTKRTNEHLTCPGCGCARDDIGVVLTVVPITRTQKSVPPGAAFGLSFAAPVSRVETTRAVRPRQ